MTQIPQDQGRTLFGVNAASYHQFRPPYPDRIFDLLKKEVDFAAGPNTLEIGAGNGLATRPLLRMGATPYTIVEPDARFNTFLEQASPDVTILNEPFEKVALPNGRFDLAVSSTAFHWIEQTSGLKKVGQLLKPNGVWAMWWHIFGDPKEPDAFHDVTQPLFATLPHSPSTGNTSHFALEKDKRFVELEGTGLFKWPFFEAMHWTLPLNAAKLRGLYATFSPIQKLEPNRREAFLDELADVVDNQFEGHVEKKMITAIYIARISK